jgi:Transposase C of IS166 homeodomain
MPIENNFLFSSRDLWKKLPLKLDLLIRKVFGANSEKIDPAQLDLFLSRECGAENAPGKSEASSALEEADPQRTGHRRVAADVAGTVHGCSRIASPDYREQILRSSSALPAGADLLDAAPGLVAETKSGPMDGTGRGLVEADLPAHPNRSHGRRLRAGR